VLPGYGFTPGDFEPIVVNQSHNSPVVASPSLSQGASGQQLDVVEAIKGFSYGAPLHFFDSLDDFIRWARSHTILSKVVSLSQTLYTDNVYNLSVLDDESYCLPEVVAHNCKCRIFSLSQRDVDREGLKVENVSDFEADKGFNYLPGKLTKQRRDELLKGLDPDIRKLVEKDGEAEFKLPEGVTRRRNGVNYILKNSRWHRADNQETVSRSRIERSSDIYELTQQFEHDMEHSPDTYESIAEKFLHDLTQFGDRDRAEAEVKGMKIQDDNRELIANAIDFCQLLDKPTGVTSIAFGAERAFARIKTGQIGARG
jgi:hypothetical protein